MPHPHPISLRASRRILSSPHYPLVNRIFCHGIVPDGIIHQPSFHLLPHGLHDLRAAHKRRHLHLHHPLRLLMHHMDRPVHLVQALCRLALLAAALLHLHAPAARVGREVRQDLVQHDVQRDAELAGDDDSLEREVGRMHGAYMPEGEYGVDDVHEQRVDQTLQDPCVLWACGGVQLEYHEREQGQPAPIDAIAKVAELGEEVEHGHGRGVVGQYVQGGLHDVISHHDALLPVQNVRSKAVVCEALHVVDERLVGGLDLDIRVDIEHGVAICLVWVHHGGQEAVAALDFFDGRIGEDTQRAVEVACPLQLPVGLVDGEEKVDAHDGNVDAPVVFSEAGGARLGMWGASADGDLVVEALGELCGPLRCWRRSC